MTINRTCATIQMKGKEENLAGIKMEKPAEHFGFPAPAVKREIQGKG